MQLFCVGVSKLPQVVIETAGIKRMVLVTQDKFSSKTDSREVGLFEGLEYRKEKFRNGTGINNAVATTGSGIWGGVWTPK